MPIPNVRQPGVLALLADPATMQPLVDHLQQLGIRVDVADSVAAARTLFFGAGGHDCLVIGPDVRPGVATQVVVTLRAVDPDLAMASFGPEVADPTRPSRHAMLAAFHPGSRAGAGALVRFLRGIRLR